MGTGKLGMTRSSEEGKPGGMTVMTLMETSKTLVETSRTWIIQRVTSIDYSDPQTGHPDRRILEEKPFGCVRLVHLSWGFIEQGAVADVLHLEQLGSRKTI